VFLSVTAHQIAVAFMRQILQWLSSAESASALNRSKAGEISSPGKINLWRAGDGLFEGSARAMGQNTCAIRQGFYNAFRLTFIEISKQSS